MDTPKPLTAEEQRLEESRARTKNWQRWGPYLSERAWGTVREDYSAAGSAWEYFPHDHARCRTYRWNEDGLAVICDRHQMICFAIALWNGRDPILKERAFGLTGNEGNHGEDVKEYFFYLDSTPTHSYMKYLYKYPQAQFPYAELLAETQRRDRSSPEFELLDTGVFNEDRYFDVFVEYAKADIEDILIRISVVNHGPDAAPLSLLPTIWFRNRWTWGTNEDPRPTLREEEAPPNATIELDHFQYGKRWLYCEGVPELLFTENDTNNQRLFGSSNSSPHVKDGINNFVVHGARDAVNTEQTGTKAAANYSLNLQPGATATVCLRLTNQSPHVGEQIFGEVFDTVFTQRIKEADEFYQTVIPAELSDDASLVMRQSIAVLLCSKQFYHYVVERCLEG